MAAPAAEYRAAQATLTSALAVQVAHAWAALLDTSRLRASIPVLAAAAAALVARYGQVSAMLAAQYYEAARLDAGVAGRFSPVPADPADLDAVTEVVKWATRDLWTPEPDVAPARAAAVAATEKLVLDAGRDTITGAVLADRKARGWARVTQPGACYFCVMLATRGAVYKTEATAGFQAHDHDHCHPEPVFTAYEPSAQVREWQALWSESTAGHSGKAAIAAFRAALGQ